MVNKDAKPLFMYSRRAPFEKAEASQHCKEPLRGTLQTTPTPPLKGGEWLDFDAVQFLIVMVWTQDSWDTPFQGGGASAPGAKRERDSAKQ